MGLYGAIPTALDPQKGYNFSIWELWRCCLGRTLLSYSGKPADEGGATPKPDLAAGMPSVSSDGVTWTFHLKPGIHYAPPMAATTVTASDFVRALDRMASTDVNPSDAYTYDFYYSVIAGFDAVRAGEASTISGLETPDPATLVLHLTHPQSDLPFLFTLPATAPIPPSPSNPSAPFGVATGHDEDYGRFLVSSGPYMIEGSDDLDLSLPPDEQRPVRGYDPFVLRFDAQGNVAGAHNGEVSLVRNPRWDRSTDLLRAAYPDRIRLLLGKVPGGERGSDPIFEAIKDGRLDMIFDADALPSEISAYQDDPGLRPYVFTLEANEVWFLTMNVAVPPFDDVHVRRAVELAVNRTTLVDISGSGYLPGSSTAATHLLPDGVEGGLLSSYRGPPWQAGKQAGLEGARAAMGQSSYDDDGDGTCDVVCRHVELLVADFGRKGLGFPLERVSDMVGEIVRELQGIGITVSVRRISDGFASGDEVRAIATDPKQRVPLTLSNWASDYPSGSAFFPYWFDGRRIGETDTYAVSLLGASPEQLAAWGYAVSSVPDVNDRLDRCLDLLAQAQVECWAELDRYLMEEIVPWVPMLFTQASRTTSTRVVNFSFDQFVGFPALDRIALAPEGG